MLVEADTQDATLDWGEGVELPWEDRNDDPEPQDLIVPERPDFLPERNVLSSETMNSDSTLDEMPDVFSSMERPVSISNDAEDEIDFPVLAPAVARSRSGWTVALLCAGLAIIACCVIIPQADANRRMAYEQKKLQLDLEQIKSQTAVNGEFLKRISTDATLAERLAQRQMKMIPRGTTVLQLRDQPGQNDVSPFLLVNLPAPTPLPAYQPVGGMIASVCTDAHQRLYLLGAGLFLIAAGLVMGGTMKEMPSLNDQASMTNK